MLVLKPLVATLDRIIARKHLSRPAMKLDDAGRILEFGEFPTLETDRLLLRRMTLDDLGFYLMHFSTPEIIQGSGFPAPADLDAAREELVTYCIKPFEENTGIRWGIELRGREGLIGTCGLHKWVKESGYRAEVGYDLQPGHWGTGIMKEALTAAIRYAFGTMALNRIELLCFRDNERSRRLAEGLGFRLEGVLREHAFFEGRFIDDLQFALLKQDWPRRPQDR